MTTLEEIAANEVRLHEGLEPPMTMVVARARRRRRSRRAALAGVALVLVGIGAAGAAWVSEDRTYQLDVADAPDSSLSDPASTTHSTTVDAPASRRVSVPAGLWLDEMLPLIASQVPGTSATDLQAVLEGGTIVSPFRSAGTGSWEGLLLPGDYELESGHDGGEILGAMTSELVRVTDELGYGAKERPLGLSPYELVIVASLVEAETEVDEDRAKIARVIYNRLEAEWSLDIDSICIYGSGDRQVELTADFMHNGAGPYACRNRLGLPPTPIAAPSEASLAAALYPAPNPIDEDGVKQPWLFYTAADAEGHHTFSSDHEDHMAEVVRLKEENLGQP